MSFTLTEFVDTEILTKIYPNKNVWIYDMQKYYNMLSNVNLKNELEVEYKQNSLKDKTSGKELFYGRYYPNRVMNGTYMSRRTRATLYGNFEYDIDIVSCHPSILKYLFIKNYSLERFKNNFPILNNYIDNRDSVIEQLQIENLEEIINVYNKTNKKDINKKDIVKDLHTLILYGGTIETWKNKFNITSNDITDDLVIQYIDKYVKEIKEITDNIVCLEEYKEFITLKTNDLMETELKKLLTNKKKHQQYLTIPAVSKTFCKEQITFLIPNINGKLLSHILQTKESEIVIEAINFIKRYAKSWFITVYAYDGFQIRYEKHNKTPETDLYVKALLSNLNNHIKKILKNESIVFIDKSFSTPFTEEELNDIDKDAKFILPFFENQNPDELSYYINDIFSDNILCCRDNYYKYSKGIWVDSSKDAILGEYRGKIYKRIKSAVRTYIDPNGNEQEMKLLTKIIDHTSNNLLSKALLIAINKNTDDQIMFDIKNNLLNAPNGTLDLDTNILQPHNPKDYLTKMVNYEIDYKLVKVGKNLIRKLNTEGDYIEKSVEIIKDWFDTGYLSEEDVIEITKYLIHYVGKSLHGNNFIEKAIVLKGILSRNGKTTFMGILKKSFGNYVGDLNLNYFTTYEKSSNAPHPEILAIQGCRIVDIAEGGGTDMRMIPHKFKTLVGGDVISERTLHSKKIIKFVNSAILFFSCNLHIAFTTQGNDTGGKIEFFEFGNYYGEEGTLGWDKNQPNHKQIDNDFKYKLNDELFKNVLQASLILRGETFDRKPNIFIKWNEQNKKEVNSVDTWLSETLSYNKNDIYFTEDDWIIKHNIFPKINEKMNKGKLERMITFDFLYNKYTNEFSKEERVNKVNFYSIIRVKYKDFIPDSKTTLFGSKKEYIKGWKYNTNEDEEDGCLIEDE
jgi:phage/plasmid-associated DNA primase